jgi:CBS domain-containing protein
MKLKEIMSHNVEAVSTESTLMAAANTMARLDIGFVPVLDGGQVVGVVTDRDIIVRAVAEGRDPNTTSVGDVMTKGLETLSPEEEVEQAAKIMKDKQIRRIVVQGDDGAYLGVVSLGDLAGRGHESELAGKTLEKVCEDTATG